MNTGKRILIADDNPVIIKALSSALKSNGYETLIALNGSEAVGWIRRERPDLILLDILFPPDVDQGIMTWDGLIIMDWLRGMGRAGDIPVIIITSADPEEYRDRCLAAGALAFFPKPLDMKQLMATIRAAFDSSAEAKRPEPEASGLVAGYVPGACVPGDMYDAAI